MTTEAQRRYRERHKHEIRAKDRERYRVLRDAIVVALGGACARCGMSDDRVLDIDHVRDDGRTHRLMHPGPSVYRAMMRDLRAGITDRYQLLCANCHLIKTYHER